MPCVIELKDISFSMQGRTIIRNTSFQFEEGKTTALIGPSGGGKSTLLKLAAGLLSPDKGEVLFRGRNIARMNRAENMAFRNESAVVFQDSALWANQNLNQILELPLQVHYPAMTQDERKRRIEAVVEMVGYKKELGIRPSLLSAGEQKLLAFARAMTCRPRLLYLDEWTESLDQGAAKRLISLVKQQRDDGVSIILVTHNMRIIQELAELVIMIEGGQITRRLTREEIETDEELYRYVEKGMTT